MADENYWNSISIVHIFFIVPLFIAVGFLRGATPIWLYWILLTIGAIVFFYHGWKAFIRWNAGSGLLWINLIHVLLIAPLLMYVGYMQKNTARFGYELLMIAGFAALGYHSYSLIKRTSEM